MTIGGEELANFLHFLIRSRPIYIDIISFMKMEYCLPQTAIKPAADDILRHNQAMAVKQAGKCVILHQENDKCVFGFSLILVEPMAEKYTII